MGTEREYHRYVMDSTALISYFSDIFQEPCKVSEKAIKLLRRAFNNDPFIRISVPSLVFVEVFTKWFRSEEIAAKIRIEIFELIKNSANFEIKSLEKEVLEKFLLLEDHIINLENHDKLILASAMMLECPLITNDPKIIKYVEKYQVIPEVIS